MKTIKKNQFAVIVGVTLVLGLAHVGARAEDTADAKAQAKAEAKAQVAAAVKAQVAADVKKEKPERPPRPEQPDKSQVRANVTELKEIIRNFQEAKKEFLQQQKELQADERVKMREAIGTLGGAIQEAKDSVGDAKRQAREQARKMADEAKEAAKENRKRDSALKEKICTVE